MKELEGKIPFKKNTVRINCPVPKMPRQPFPSKIATKFEGTTYTDPL